MYVIIKRLGFVLLFLFITIVDFAQVTTTISAGSNWKDANSLVCVLTIVVI